MPVTHIAGKSGKMFRVEFLWSCKQPSKSYRILLIEVATGRAWVMKIPVFTDWWK